MPFHRLLYFHELSKKIVMITLLDTLLMISSLIKMLAPQVGPISLLFVFMNLRIRAHACSPLMTFISSIRSIFVLPDIFPAPRPIILCGRCVKIFLFIFAWIGDDLSTSMPIDLSFGNSSLIFLIFLKMFHLFLSSK